MNKTSELFLVILSCLALLAFYQSLFPLSATIAFDRFLALSGFFLLCVTLMLGPLAFLRPKTLAHLPESRRATGIAAAVLIAMHFLAVFLVQYGGQSSAISSQFPILVALPALAIILVLALLSNNYSVRLLGGGNWKKVQLLAYVAFALGFAHFILEANGLFKPLGSVVFVNLAEVFALAAGTATIVLQVTAFVVRMRRKAGSETKAMVE